jgi:adenylate cyclase
MMAKILVVDDETDLELLIRQKFRKKIRENKYEFVFAQNGNQALEIVKIHRDLDLILSDINMPEMDGLTLLTKVPDANPLLKTVIVSAYGDMENIRSAMNKGAFDFVCKPVDFEDLELTMEKTLLHVTQLRATLQAIKENDILKMYVDEAVLKFMVGEEFESTLLRNETIHGTVMFIDLCGFTAISEKISANAVVGLINRFFDMMVQEIIAQGGLVDKFMGDAVMAVFQGEYHEDRAIDAALALREKLDKMEEIVVEDVVFLPKVSVGINSGEMVSGNIGSASLRRLDFTVIGDTVNMAQRLQAAARPGQIVLTKELYEKVKNSFDCALIGDVNFKNKSRPITIYEVLG